MKQAPPEDAAAVVLGVVTHFTVTAGAPLPEQAIRCGVDAARVSRQLWSPTCTVLCRCIWATGLEVALC